MTDKATIVKVLYRAAELCEQAWCQESFGRVEDGRTSYCMFGAIRQARFDIDPDQALSDITKPIVREITGPDSIAIAVWNDKPKRTQKDVVDMLRAVARKVEAEG